MRVPIIAVFLNLVFCSISSYAQQPITAFYYTGSRSSSITRGETGTITPADGYVFSARDCYTDETTKDCLMIGVEKWSANDVWTLFFLAPYNQPLTAGTYHNVTGFPGTGTPVLDVRHPGSSPSIVSGQFTILEIAFSGGSLVSCAADYILFEGDTAHWNYGSIRYNSSIPLNAVPPLPDQVPASFFFTGSPSSYSSRGITAILTADSNTNISFVINNPNAEPPSPDRVLISIRNQEGLDFELIFGMAAGQPLVPGTYLNTVWPPPSDLSLPGLKFFPPSYYDNPLTGYFTILEATYYGGLLFSFAADFMQYDYGSPDLWNYGSIRYNSTIPLNFLPLKQLSVACTDSDGPITSGAYGYETKCYADGGVGPYQWSVVDGQLPQGFSLGPNFAPNNSWVVISGSPQSLGPFHYAIQVTDSQNHAASQVFSGTTLKGVCHIGNELGTSSDGFKFGPAGKGQFLPMSYHFPEAGCPWSLSSDIPGLRFSSSSGTSDGTSKDVYVAVLPPSNDSPFPIHGSIVITSGRTAVQTVPVLINSRSCTFSLGTTSAHFGSAGGSGSFDVVANPSDCHPFDDSTDPLLTYDHGKYYFGVDPNQGVSRSGAFRIAASPDFKSESMISTFRWTQDSGDPSFVMGCFAPGPAKVGFTLAHCTALGGQLPYSWSISEGVAQADYGQNGPILYNTNYGSVNVGTPTAVGPYRFTIRATDRSAPLPKVAIYTVAGSIAPAEPHISCTSVGGLVQEGTSYGIACVPYYGTPPYQWRISSGEIPPGLSLQPRAGGWISIAGAPVKAGDYRFTLELSDSTGPTFLNAYQLVSFRIEPKGSQTERFEARCSSQYPDFPYGSEMGTPIRPFACSASGGTFPYQWSMHAGGLPPGLSLSDTSGNAVLVSGMPSDYGGQFERFLKVTDSSPTPQARLIRLSLDIRGHSTFDCSISTGKVGQPYGADCHLTFAKAWVSAGMLPPGLKIQDGYIQGTPTTPGKYSFTISTRSPHSWIESESYTISIDPPPPDLDLSTFAGSMAQIAVNGGWDTTTVLINPADTYSQANVSYVSDSGAPLSLPISIEPAQITSRGASTGTQIIPAHGIITVTSAGEDSSPVQAGAARLAREGIVSGFVRYRYAPTGQEAIVPLETRSAESFTLSFDNTGGIDTGVAVSNLKSSPANITAIIRDDSGARISTASLTLPGYGHDAFMFSERFTGTANQTGTVEFLTPANGQVGVVGLRFPPSAHFTTIPVAANTDPGTGIISELVAGGGWETTVEIINTSESAAAAQLLLYNDDGSPLVLRLSTPGGLITSPAWNGLIPPHGRVVIKSEDLPSATAQVGSARLISVAGVSAFVRYVYVPWDQELIAPLLTHALSAYALGYDNMEGTDTGVAIANASTSDATIPVMIYDQRGELAGSSSVALPANGHAAFYLTERFGATRNQRGTVEFRIPQNGSIGILGIRFPISQAFTTIPPVSR